jgi:hypothetical protein
VLVRGQISGTGLCSGTDQIAVLFFQFLVSISAGTEMKRFSFDFWLLQFNCCYFDSVSVINREPTDNNWKILTLHIEASTFGQVPPSNSQLFPPSSYYPLQV